MYEEETEVTLTASSNDILTFTNWNDGETGAERKIKMNVDQSYTAAYSAKDFIAGWDFYKSAREGRTADFAAEDNDVDQLILRDADGNTYTWSTRATVLAATKERMQLETGPPRKPSHWVRPTGRPRSTNSLYRHQGKRAACSTIITHTKHIM